MNGTTIHPCYSALDAIHCEPQANLHHNLSPTLSRRTTALIPSPPPCLTHRNANTEFPLCFPEPTPRNTTPRDDAFHAASPAASPATAPEAWAVRGLDGCCCCGRSGSPRRFPGPRSCWRAWPAAEAEAVPAMPAVPGSPFLGKTQTWGRSLSKAR